MGQRPALTSRPLESASLCSSPSGDAVYTARRPGSAAGLALVIWEDPSQRRIPAGVKVHRMRPVAASIATVRP